MTREQIKEAIKLVEEAGRAILNVYDSNKFEIQIKNDHSPLTIADITSNKILTKGLSAHTSYPILSEEEEVGFEIRKKWKKFWLIDPLDGTKDFIAKNDEFTINVALIDGNRPVFGIIYIPALQILYHAQKGMGAFRNNILISNDSRRNSLKGTLSRFHSNKETLDFFKHNKIKQFSNYGSATKFCKLAEGTVDVYPRYTGSMEWDTAAGDIILEEAGCQIIDIETNKKLLYNKENLLNGHFIAARNQLFNNQILTF
jgi:3'(2'), 5'-bisphosphate nucleotidase